MAKKAVTDFQSPIAQARQTEAAKINRLRALRLEHDAAEKDRADAVSVTSPSVIRKRTVTKVN